MGLSARLSECPSIRTPTIVYFVVGVRPSVGMSVYQNAHHCVLCGWCPPIYQNFHHCVLCGWCPPVCRNVCLPESPPLCTLWVVSARLSECLSTRTSTIVYFVDGHRPSVGMCLQERPPLCTLRVVSVGMSVNQNVHHCVLCGWCPPVCRNVCLPERPPLCTF